jgi:hypothetical protein
MFKTRRTKWAKHVKRMKTETHTKYFLENLKERDLLKDLGVDGKH